MNPLVVSSKLKLRDETTYLRKKSKTKYCIIQKLLESQKVIQDEISCKTFNTINKIHAEKKAVFSLYLKRLHQMLCYLQPFQIQIVLTFYPMVPKI